MLNTSRSDRFIRGEGALYIYWVGSCVDLRAFMYTLRREKEISSLQEFQPKFMDCRQSSVMDRHRRPCGIIGCYEAAMSPALQEEILW
jgi:hypothetical protein